MRCLYAWLGLLAACQGPGALEVERVVPSSGLATADVQVQIEGSNFALPIHSSIDDGTTSVGAMTVTVGDVPVIAVTWQDAQLIEAVIPAGLAPGTYAVTVTLGDRSDVLPDGYTVVDRISPAFDLPLVPPDLVAPPGSTLVLPDGATIDTSAVAVTGAAAGSTYDVRTDDAAPCAIAFVVAERIEITGRVRVTGNRSIALIAQHTLVVHPSGVLDSGGAQTAGGPGGWPGGDEAVVGGGPGGGGLGTYYTTCCDSGAGGAGFAAMGGGGGASGLATGGGGGDAVSVGLDRLCGGSGGGGTSGPAFAGCPDRGGDGGGGGGGVMVGSYGTLEVAGAITAGGAGGRGSPGCGGGGGGGAGGTIVLAAPSVNFTGVVAANGGGGGGGGDPTPGAPGTDGCACATSATGGAAYTAGSPGGSGGAGSSLAGAASTAHPNNGGGGGGAAGRLFIATAPGTPPALTGTLSPAVTTSAVSLLDLVPAP